MLLCKTCIFCDFEESIDFSVLSLFYWVGLRSEIERVRLDFTREIKGFTILGSITDFLVKNDGSG